MKNRLSIYVPNYNHGIYLRRCLDSIVTQSRKPDQLVIVDDGSTDDSVSIMREYQRKYSFIEVYVNEKNIGANKTVAFACEKLNGEYMYGIAADDYLLPDWLEKAMNASHLFPEVGIIFGNTLILNESSKVAAMACFKNGGSPLKICSDQYWKHIVKQKYFSYMTSCCIYKRILWESIGGFRTEIGHCTDNFAANTIGYMSGACHIPHLGHVFVQHETSFSANQHADMDKLINIAFEIEKTLKTEPFCKYFSESMIKHWVKEMKKVAVELPVLKSLQQKGKERKTCWDEYKKSERSKTKLTIRWVRLKFEAMFVRTFFKIKIIYLVFKLSAKKDSSATSMLQS